MKITLTVQVQDPTEVIENAVLDLGDVSGVGANGDSSYEIISATATSQDGVNFDVDVEVERTEGLFASKDDVAQAIVDSIDTDVTIPLEVSY
jgi:phosphotransferase system IIB component